jgi:hypothetical protein
MAQLLAVNILQTLIPLQLILEAKLILFIRELQKVEHLGTGFHDGERWGL